MKKYSIGWGLTNLCNMNCKFCYSKAARQNSCNAKLEDWIKFVDLNYENIDSINYGTGENTILDDFFTFINYVRDNYPEITQSLTTNGHLYERVNMDPNLYEIYLKCIDEVDVSLDFADKEKHNEFRGQKKAYDWAINTLRMLQNDLKKATIVTVAFNNTMTLENIEELFKIADRYSAYMRFNIFRPTTKNSKINNEFILSYEKLYNALEYINQKHHILSLNDALLGNLLTNDSIVDNTGITSIRILPNGKIFPSTYLISDKYVTGNTIYDGKILNELEFENFEIEKTPVACADCKLREKCNGGVIDRRYLWYDTLDERDPYCPTRYGDSIEKEKYKTYKKERISVHDGYLPTLFFKN